MSTSDLLDEVRRWLRFAREDLEAAETLLVDLDDASLVPPPPDSQ